jgi:hypothetical protein
MTYAYVICDVCGTIRLQIKGNIRGYIKITSTLKDLRRMLHYQGWNPGCEQYDLCPDCYKPKKLSLK